MQDESEKYQNVIVDKFVYIVGVTAIIHGILERSQVLAVHVQHNVPHPVHPPASQPQIPLENAPARV